MSNELFGLNDLVEKLLSEHFKLVNVEGIEEELLKKEKVEGEMESGIYTKVLKSECGTLPYIVFSDTIIKNTMRITPATIYSNPALGIPPISYDSSEMKDTSLFFIIDLMSLSKDEDYLKKFVMDYFGGDFENHNKILKQGAMERDKEKWHKEIASPVCIDYKWVYDDAMNITSLKENVRNAAASYINSWIKMVKEAKPVEDKGHLQKLISYGDDIMKKFQINDKGFKVLKHYYGIDFAERYMQLLFPNVSELRVK